MLGMLGGALYIPKKIYLIDLDVSLVDAWRTQFRQYKDTVEALSCDYFDIPADCMVSPANSFGYMDGGLDRIISYELVSHMRHSFRPCLREVLGQVHNAVSRFLHCVFAHDHSIRHP